MAAEARGRGFRVMIAMPVLAPRADLQRAKPPDVLAGIHTIGKASFEMQKAVYEALHVKAVKHADSAEPEKPCPAKHEVPETERDHHQRDLDFSPKRVSRFHEIRAPFFHARRFPLIKPPHVSPPETAVPRA